MPGETILLIDDSQAVQDIAQTALHQAGYHVNTASNGAAALAYPGIDDIEMIVMGADLDGLTGEETNRLLKQHTETHHIPVLMLVPEEGSSERESLTLGGAFGYLFKPFDPGSLVRKVDQLFEQKNLDEMSQQYLSDAADGLMKKLADDQINQAVERKTELIIQRCIQNITTQVDDRARQEVESRVTGLINEKEQELVKLTVREVANAMVEKLAVNKVEEAMEQILLESTEKEVHRICESVLPNTIRDRSKEMLNNILPREVEKQLQRSADKMIPAISEQLMQTVEGVAKKSVPKIARELLPPLVESQIKQITESRLPRMVSDLVAKELNTQMSNKFEPSIQKAVNRVKRSAMIFNVTLGLALCGAFGFLVWLQIWGPLAK